MAFDQPLPKSLSPSRLSDFQTCPRRYQHASVERIPQARDVRHGEGTVRSLRLEQLFLFRELPSDIERAREFIEPAKAQILTDEVRVDIGLDETMMSKLLAETEAIIVRYFAMEDPTSVKSEGGRVAPGRGRERNTSVGHSRSPRSCRRRLAHHCRLQDRSSANRNYDSHTFANTELYAALCEAELGERPTTIRLMYVAHGQSIDRSVSEVVVKARANAAAGAWVKINRYYDDGDFPATPSVNACRFVPSRTSVAARACRFPVASS